jgi:hypothetical protein
MTARPFLFAIFFMLAGCDKIETLLADPKVAQRIADSKAIGSACRYGLRSIEDCYTKNEKASKAAVFEGWKEMDQYMRDNKIDGVPSREDKPQLPVEEIIDPKPKSATAKDKPGSEGKPKPNAQAAIKPASGTAN